MNSIWFASGLWIMGVVIRRDVTFVTDQLINRSAVSEIAAAGLRVILGLGHIACGVSVTHCRARLPNTGQQIPLTLIISCIQAYSQLNIPVYGLRNSGSKHRHISTGGILRQVLVLIWPMARDVLSGPQCAVFGFFISKNFFPW